MDILLTDLDEVLFPFATAYRDWLKLRHGRDIPADVWDDYQLNETGIPGHQSMMVPFFSDHSTLADVRPIKAGFTVLKRLSERYTIIGCTARYEATEGPATRAWTTRHVPWLTSVVFTDWHPESGTKSKKADVAARMQAVALIDDRPEHLEGLSGPTAPLLVTRPPGVPSAPGALTWEQVERRLTR